MYLARVPFSFELSSTCSHIARMRASMETGGSEQAAGIVIVGAHRSGTSALAGALAKLGWRLPKTLIGAGRGNLLGHFEPKHVIDMNDRILDASGRSWFDPKPLPSDWQSPADVKQAQAEVPELLRQEFADLPYLVKDPRLSLLMPHWLPALKDLGGAPMVVVACRNPYEVAKSLRKRNGFTVPHGLALWHSYMLEAERHTRGLPRMAVFYDNLLESAEDVLTQIVLKAGGSVEAGDQRLRDAAQSVSGHERHASINDETFLQNEKVPVEIRETYKALCSPLGLEDAGYFDAARSQWVRKWEKESPGQEPSRVALDQPETQLKFSLAAQARGDVENAFKHARKAAALAPEQVIYQVHLAKLLVRNQQFPEAVDLLRAALSIDPAHAGGMHLLVDALRRAGRQSEALETLRKALESRPDDQALTLQLGQLLTETGAYEAAVYTICLAEGFHGSTGQSRLMLSHAFRKAGRKDVARSYARQAHDLSPRQPLERIAAAMQIAKCGSPAEAEILIRAVLGAGDAPVAAQAALDWLLAKGR